MHDVVIVGGGPAGSLAARGLASHGFDVKVLEEHQSIGVPMQCAGLVTEEVIKMSGVKPERYNTLYGAEVVFPDGRSVTVRSDKPKAVAINRTDLDIKLAYSAMEQGASYSMGDRYTEYRAEDFVRVMSTSGVHRAMAIVGADGAMSKVAMSLGDNRPQEYVRGIEVDVKHRAEDQGIFKMRLGTKVAPGFFTWEIPCGDFTRIGLCTRWSAGPPSSYLDALLIKLGVEDKVMRVYSGKIPLGGRQITYGDRCLLTGDAAGFVKPISGGGLYPTFKVTPILVDKLSSALEEDAMYARDLADYEREWRKVIGSDLKNGYVLRKTFKKMTDDDMNSAYRVASSPDSIRKLSDIDIDHPAEALKMILRQPKSFVSLLGTALGIGR